MKQRITTEQLNELSDNGKKRLKEWWKPEYGDWYAVRYGKRITKKEYLYVDQLGYDIVDDIIARDDIPEKALPILSIGQMIEFLKESIPTGQLSLSLIKEINRESGYIDFKNPDNWCDELWKAVKDVLDKHQ